MPQSKISDGFEKTETVLTMEIAIALLDDILGPEEENDPDPPPNGGSQLGVKLWLGSRSNDYDLASATSAR
ncbi:hypothetical protein SS37A_42460 (plasmid) [Methylocystis iwaonis]|uniref:Uncharacterized protein n=1 Tax=Methylocystis iwaonis TaxID=2885079 RepID=A0ABN6VPF8_9HYPH|nr:hypothetical protein SS37A_42460 [Methylocystis iwaonis]